MDDYLPHEETVVMQTAAERFCTDMAVEHHRGWVRLVFSVEGSGPREQRLVATHVMTRADWERVRESLFGREDEIG